MARFYVDNDVSLRLADLLRDAGHDVVTTRDLGQQAAGDHEQLWLAANTERILVTHNWRDFHLLHQAWCFWFRGLLTSEPVRVRRWRVRFSATLAACPSHAGIVVIPQGRPVEALATHRDRLVADVTNDGGLWDSRYRFRDGAWQTRD